MILDSGLLFLGHPVCNKGLLSWERYIQGVFCLSLVVVTVSLLSVRCTSALQCLSRSVSGHWSFCHLLSGGGPV